MTTQQCIKQTTKDSKETFVQQGACVDKILMVHLRNVYGISPWSYYKIDPNKLQQEMEKVRQ